LAAVQVLRYTEFRMLLIAHAPILLALLALQFHACSIDKPPAFWFQFRRVLTIVAIAAAPICFYIGDVVGTRAAIAALIIVATGLLHKRYSIARWYRWLALASWCLCILAAIAVIGYLVTRRFFI
jgi:hypothetical protein